MWASAGANLVGLGIVSDAATSNGCIRVYLTTPSLDLARGVRPGALVEAGASGASKIGSDGMIRSAAAPVQPPIGPPRTSVHHPQPSRRSVPTDWNSDTLRHRIGAIVRGSFSLVQGQSEKRFAVCAILAVPAAMLVMWLGSDALRLHRV